MMKRTIIFWLTVKKVISITKKSSLKKHEMVKRQSINLKKGSNLFAQT
jgi:hypothetical protein